MAHVFSKSFSGFFLPRRCPQLRLLLAALLRRLVGLVLVRFTGLGPLELGQLFGFQFLHPLLEAVQRTVFWQFCSSYHF